MDVPMDVQCKRTSECTAIVSLRKKERKVYEYMSRYKYVLKSFDAFSRPFFSFTF